MKRGNTLKRGNGFKKVVGNSLLISKKDLKPYHISMKSKAFKYGFTKSTLKKSSFKRTLTDIQKEVRESDSKFSEFIINRDKKCLRCGSTQMLTCSHFHGRSNWATRFEPLNCITLCIDCHHIWESKKTTDYLGFMMYYLGNEQFFVLERISKMNISKTDSLLLAKNLFNKVEINKDIQY